VAGLRCADVLLDQGFEVTILEARERIGGRCHQVALQTGPLVDLGPNWIHGTDGNPILELAEKTNTATHSVRVRISFDHHCCMNSCQNLVADSSYSSGMDKSISLVKMQSWSRTEHN
jgi:phytoene dehydrogenase-like protein